MAESLITFFILLVGTVLVDLLFRFTVSKYLKSNPNKQSMLYIFAQKMIAPINKIIYITGVYFAVSSLDLIESTQASFQSIYMVLMFVVTSWLAFRVIDCLGCIVSDQLSKHEEASVMYFVPIMTRTLNVFTGAVILVILLQKLGYNVTSLLAGLGITGLAVGFAAKETLSDILGSFTVILDNVFKIGDMIVLEEKIDGETVQGVVEDISLLSTKIRALDNSLILVSNHRISNMTVKNLSRRSKFRIHEFLGLSYNTDSQKLQRAVEICREAAKNHPQIEEGVNIYFTNFGENALKIIFNAYANTVDYNEFLEIREELFSEIKKDFESENIEFAVQALPFKN